jgi:RNA polymerase sigma factor (sigma-70 family)
VGSVSRALSTGSPRGQNFQEILVGHLTLGVLTGPTVCMGPPPPSAPTPARRFGGVPELNADASGVPQVVAAPQPHRSASPPIGVEKFFREHYRDLVATAMYVGATKEQAEDAATAAVEEMLRPDPDSPGHRAWDRIDDPLRWARKAVISHFLKEKTRGPGRIRDRLVEKGAVTAEGSDELSLWEDSHWVTQMLESLTRKQREVMTLVINGFSPTQIADLLGRSREAVWQNLLGARTRLQRELQQEPGGAQQPSDNVSPTRRRP